METNHVVAEYGSHTVDFATLPVTSQVALVSRGLTHFLGNEQASKLQAWIVKESGAEGETAKATAKAWKDNEEHAGVIEAKMAELQEAAFAALLAGTVGVRVSGPRATPLDSAKRAIAKKEVLAILAGAKIAAPKKDEKVKFADGREKSLDEMIATRLDHAEHGPRIVKEAEKMIAAEAKKLGTLKESAEAASSEL